MLKSSQLIQSQTSPIPINTQVPTKSIIIEPNHQTPKSETQLVLGIEALRLIVSSQVSISKNSLHSFSLQETFDRRDVQVQHDFGKMRVLDSSKEVTIDEAHIRLMEMMPLLPNDIFGGFVPIQKVKISLVNVRIADKVFISQYKNRTLNFLVHFCFSKREKLWIQQDYLRNLSSEFRLKTMIGLDNCSTSIRVSHEDQSTFLYLQHSLIKLCCSCLNLPLSESLELMPVLQFWFDNF